MLQLDAGVGTQTRRRELRRAIGLVGWGVFVSTITQTFPRMLADLPLRQLLQDRVGPVRMASFFLVAMAPWYFKPAAGLLSDCFPLMGTRRRSYLVLGATAAGGLWLLTGIVPPTYAALLILATAMNVFLVVVSSAIGGLLVERGQELGATGRLTSARSVVMAASAVGGGVIGGVLAVHPFLLTTAVNGLLVLSLVPVVLLLLHEPPAQAPVLAAPPRAARQLGRLVRCGTMWAAAGMLFLIHLSPGFSTPLFDYLKHDLSMPVPFIGVLTSVYGVAGIIASLGYALVCRRINLGSLLAIAIVCAAGGALVFLAPLTRANALVAFAAWGFGSTAAQLAGLDLAARASPRGIEAMAYSLMASAWNISLNLSDVTGSALWDRLHHHFGPLVLINAGTTLLVLAAIPFLPRALTAGREGDLPAAEPVDECRGLPVEA